MPFPERPAGLLRVVIGTDPDNEIDDHFAIAWALLSTNELSVGGIHAAPFCHCHYFEAIDTAAKRRGGRRTELKTVAGMIGSKRWKKMTSESSPSKSES